jgi:hypothetical protein
MESDDTLAPCAAIDPLPILVESRFRLLAERSAGNDQNNEDAISRRVAQFRARRLDERIVTTVATSAEGLLAQLRLLACFYDESLNGAGRRGSLLIQTIAAGIEQIDRVAQGGVNSTMDARQALFRSSGADWMPHGTTAPPGAG